MKKLILMPLLLASSAAAQWVQNSDISFLFGAAPFGSRVVPGSSATIDGYTASCASFRYGYQVARISAASLWLELAQGTYVNGSIARGSLPGSTLNNMMAYTAGPRLMIPLQSRISVYGALGGGGGEFYYPTVSGGNTPFLRSNSIWHGVFELGAGVDFRLITHISIRTEVRDFISGKGLSGSAGRHHILPFAGFSFHF